MKRLIPGILLIGWLIFSSQGHAAEPNDILGQWVTEDKDCRVEIFKKRDRYFGRIAAIKPPHYLPGEIEGMDGRPRLDSNNQIEALRSRPMAGIELMKNFRFDHGKWVDGRIYDPKNGKTYDCEISLEEDGALHVRGYVGISLLGRTTIWESARVYCKKEMAFLGMAGCSCR